MNETPVRFLEQIMGTVFTFEIHPQAGVPERELHMCFARSRTFLRRVDAVFSLWKVQSPMSQIRRGELKVSDAPKEVGEVLELCSRAKALTGGWFDADCLPGGVDPTGLVKGWSTQHVVTLFRQAGFENVIVNAGGDIFTSGSPGNDEPFRIGIRHPQDPTGLAAIIEVDGAIATSGAYERGQHLYNPVSKRYATRFASATVTGPDLAMADAAATALVIAGEEGIEFVEELPSYECFTIALDGSTRRTSGCRVVLPESSCV